MFSSIQEALPALIATHGYWIVGLIIALESMGIPLPGETTLVTAAIYAGATGNLDIGWLITSAIVGAVIGDNIGYWLGREIGYPLLLRYGSYVGLDERKLKLGRYLFERYGGSVVFWGRFVPVLRILAAFLAGAHHMAWRRFLVANLAGGVLWATIIGLAAHTLGQQAHHLLGPFGMVAFLAAVVVIGGMILFVRRHEARLTEEAEQAFPGPLSVPRG